MVSKDANTLSSTFTRRALTRNKKYGFWFKIISLEKRINHKPHHVFEWLQKDGSPNVIKCWVEKSPLSKIEWRRKDISNRTHPLFYVRSHCCKFINSKIIMKYWSTLSVVQDAAYIIKRTFCFSSSKLNILLILFSSVL